MGVRKRDPWFSPVERRMKFLAGPALAGVVCVVAGYLAPSPVRPLWMLGVVLIVPLFVYAFILLPVWHWKDRYRGDHSHLWGAMLMIQLSGVGQLVYWLRHILPDWTTRGRYYEA